MLVCLPPVCAQEYPHTTSQRMWSAVILSHRDILSLSFKQPNHFIFAIHQNKSDDKEEYCWENCCSALCISNTRLGFSSSVRLKIKLNCSQGRSAWIMEHCTPRGKELFVVRPNVRSRIRRESAFLSRSRLPVNDNPMEWLIWAGWIEASRDETSRTVRMTLV